jgi:hypothetical protein
MMNWKGCGRKRSWPYYPGIFLEGLRKIIKKPVGKTGLRAELGA